LKKPAVLLSVLLLSLVLLLSVTQMASAQTIIARITVGSPRVAFFDSSNGDLYVNAACMNAHHVRSCVAVIDGNQNKVVTTLNINGPLLTFNPSNGDVYAANYTNGGAQVLVISSTTNSVEKALPIVGYPASGAFDTSNGRIYLPVSVKINVADYDNIITIINSTTETTIANITTGGSNSPNTGSLAFDPSNGDIYNTDWLTGSVRVIDGSTNSVIATLSLPTQGPGAVAFSPSNGQVYVANPNYGNITIIDGATNRIVGEIQFKTSSPCAFTYDSSNKNIYVLDDVGGITEIDESNQIVGTPLSISSGGGMCLYPNGAFDSTNGYLYFGWYDAINSSLGTVAVIAPSSASISTTATITIPTTQTTTSATSSTGAVISSTTPITTTSTPIILSTSLSTSSAASATASGGIPEFPYQVLTAAVFVAAVVAAYTLTRRHKSRSGPSVKDSSRELV
jgi:YVTN family beta-propeller protein